MAQNLDPSGPEYLTAASVAKLLGVSPATVRSWATSGILPCHKTVGGHRRYKLTEMLEFAVQHDLLKEASPTELRLRVLVVDDDIACAQAVSTQMMKSNPALDICLCTDGFEAGFRLREFKPHIVILDLQMPGIDGYAVCELIQRELGVDSTCVVALTGAKTHDIEARICSLGAVACLEKPLKLPELHAVLNSHFKGTPQANLIQASTVLPEKV